MTLFGNRVVEDVISLDDVILEWGGSYDCVLMTVSPVGTLRTGVLIRENRDMDIQSGGSHVKRRAHTHTHTHTHSGRMPCEHEGKDQGAVPTN